MHCKGYDTYIVLSWLVSEITTRDCGASTCEFNMCFLVVSFHLFGPNLNYQQHNGVNITYTGGPGDHDLATVLWSADAWLKLLHGAGWFLDPEEQEQKEIIGDLFMKTYVGLASQAVQAGKKCGVQGPNSICVTTCSWNKGLPEGTPYWGELGWMKTLSRESLE